MTMRTLLLLLTAPLLSSLRAQTSIPPIVQKGLDALSTGRCEDALDLWTKHWLDVQKAQMAPTCSTLRQYGGELHGYDMLRAVDITPHLSRVYIVLLYDVQPVYLMVVLYRPGEADWRVSTVNWNTDPDKVVPASIVGPQRP